MTTNPVCFGGVNMLSVINSTISSRSFNGCIPEPFSVVFNLEGCLGENPVVTPSNNTQVITPSARNRFLNSVTVTAQNPAYYTSTISGTGTDTVTINGASKVASSDTAVATATLAGTTVSITGVAAGTAVISVFDVAGALIATIYTTVTA
jgi:hypothetical protein